MRIMMKTDGESEDIQISRDIDNNKAYPIHQIKSHDKRIKMLLIKKKTR